MADKGIIFSAPMVRALLDGRKTQTRRLLNPQPEFVTGRGRRIYRDVDWRKTWREDCDDDLPYSHGDRLYVREAWSHTGQGVWTIQAARIVGRSGVIYRADGDVPGAKYWPSIHLPREFSRLWLAVTDVRVQRVQDISEADALAEGIQPSPGGWWSGADGQAAANPQAAFALLWNSLHTKHGETWDDNPWIVAVTFDVHRGNIDAAVPA